MKAKITYLFVLFLLSVVGRAQIYFNNRYDNFNNGDISTGINTLGQDYLFYGCTANSLSFYSLNLGIVNSNGVRTKSKTYNRGSNLFVPNNSKCIINSSDNFIIAGGHTYKPDTSMAFLWRFNSNLDSLSYKEYGFLNKTNQVLGIIKDTTKYIYMVGWTDSLYKNTQILLIKADTSGNEIWKKKIGLPGWDETGYCIKLSSDGNLLVSGNKRTHNNYTNNGAYILKLDTAGVVLWEQHFPSNYGIPAMGLIELANGDIVAAAARGYGANVQRPQLIKLDISGNIIFNKVYGNDTDRAEFYSLILNDNGNLVAAGQNYYPSLGGRVNGLMYEFNQNGDSLFSKEYYVEQGSQNYFRDVVQAPDKGYVFAGFITPVFPNGGTGTQDIWLIKTDSTFCESTISCGYPTGLMKLNKTEDNILVYPNPAQNEVYFKLENPDPEDLNLTLTDILGSSKQCKINSTINNEIKVDVSSLSDGMYYFSVEQKNSPALTGKITIAK